MAESIGYRARTMGSIAAARAIRASLGAGNDCSALPGTTAPRERVLTPGVVPLASCGPRRIEAGRCEATGRRTGPCVFVGRSRVTREGSEFSMTAYQDPKSFATGPPNRAWHVSSNRSRRSVRPRASHKKTRLYSLKSSLTPSRLRSPTRGRVNVIAMSRSPSPSKSASPIFSFTSQS